MNADERSALNAGSEEFFILVCDSPSGSVTFMSYPGTTAGMFPKSPGTYVVPTIYGLVPGSVLMAMSLSDSSQWLPSEDGSFVVTTFGGGRFAGHFSVTIATTDGSRSASLSGTFDLGCTGSVCT